MGYRKFLLSLISIFLLNVNYAKAEEIGGDISGVYTFSEDTFISEESHINLTNLKITKPIFINNKGKVYAETSEIADTCSISIQNEGEFNVNFKPEDNSKITQIIKSDGDITKIGGLTSGFYIHVFGDNEVSLPRILDLGVNAEEISLEDSHLNLRSNTRSLPMIRHMPKIELIGNTFIRVDSVSDLNNSPILSNIEGDGKILVYIEGLDPLFVVRTYIKDKNVYAYVDREMDYFKILNNRTGKFINHIRATNPNDKLLAKLDSLTNVRSLQKVMSDSVRINPIKLMNPIRTFDSFRKASIDNGRGEDSFSIAPDYIYSNNFYLHGIGGNLGFSLSENTDILVSAYIGKLKYSDSINEYGAIIYGGNFRLTSENESFIFRNILGLSLADFDCGTVFNGNNVLYNPLGLSVYDVADIGKRFSFGSNLSVIPFVGLSSNYISVANRSNFNLDANLGADFSISTRTADIDYEYGLYSRITSSCEAFLALKMTFWSAADAAGMGAKIGLIHNNDTGFSYLAEIYVKSNF